ncbi:UNVERIFIED_CONTAM: Oligosaccharide translocation protein rft1 [Siphonaria sp. JEL0065]|nr:Oligosaccharide translocation protein rft1 [Siphonaria sp. JEL0065]
MALLRSASTLPTGTQTLTKLQYIHHQRLVNLAYLPIAIGSLIISAISGYYTFIAAPTQAYMFQAILIFLASAFVELVSEPFYTLGVNNMYFSVRVRIEGAAVLVKCFVAIGLLKWASRYVVDGVVSEESGVLAFAWSQMGYASVLALSYVVVFLIKYSKVTVEGKGLPQGIALLAPRIIEEVQEEKSIRYFIDPVLSGLASTFAKQGLFKHFLTEGDKILSVTFITAAIQGDYSLVEKYGSIVARLLFQPIEEMSRVFFSKTLSSSSSLPDSATPSKENAIKSLTLLTLLLRLYVLLSLYFLAFGTNYTALLIDLLASRTFSTGSAPSVFDAYLLYIPLLAINGVTEAFLQSVAPKSVLMRQSYWMAVCWAVFFVSGWAGIKVLGLGGVGVVVANCLNMGMRIWFAWGFVREYFEGVVAKIVEESDDKQEKRQVSSLSRKEDEKKEDEKLKKQMVGLLDVWELLPRNMLVWAAFGAAWAVTYTSNDLIGWQTMRAKVQHIGVGIITFLSVTVVIFFAEKKLFVQVKQFYRNMK